MKVVSWNAFLSPIMYGRHSRRALVHHALATWYSEGVDVVALQEVHSFAAGPVSHAAYRLMQCWGLLCALPWLARLLDILMVVEARLWPFAVLDDVADVQDAARSVGFVHAARPPAATAQACMGLLLVSRHPLRERGWEYFPPDAIHPAGALWASVLAPGWERPVDVLTLHLVPSLPNRTPSYVFTNVVNALMRRHPRRLRKRAAARLRWWAGRGRGRAAVVAGDWNVHRGEELDELVADVGMAHVPFADPAAPTAPHDALQIDHVLTARCAPVGAAAIDTRFSEPLWEGGSDHHAVVVTVAGASSSSIGSPGGVGSPGWDGGISF